MPYDHVGCAMMRKQLRSFVRHVTIPAALVLALSAGGDGIRAAATPPRPDGDDKVLAQAVDQLLQQLQDNRQDLGGVPWSKSLRDLILLGPAATPILTRRLEETEDGYRIRCIVFALRGIGDKRAIPALIRAIPKTLQPSASDYGLQCQDAALHQFLQAHDTDFDDSDSHFSFGRPISEVHRTLRQWTGQDCGYSEIVFVSREGGRAQQGATAAGLYGRGRALR